MELLSEIEQLIKDTEELRSEKGMRMCFASVRAYSVVNVFYYPRIRVRAGRRIVHTKHAGAH